MDTLDKLKNCKSKFGLSKIIGIKLKKITYILFVKKYNLYTEFQIPKNNGKFRNISAPNKYLKIIQKKLKKVLEECYNEIQLNKNASHGFLKKKSIYTNSNFHKNKRYVLNIDLKDFFPSINFGRVRGFFIKNKNFQLNEEVATLIAQISCYNNQLPQGSPSSPIISNLIAISLDKGLSILSKKYKFNYTRYADDITISTNLKNFPIAIAYKDKDGNWKLGSELIKVINNNHFDINFDKIRMQYKSSRQEVTGLIVNKKVNVKRNYIRKTRLMLYNLIKNPNSDDYQSIRNCIEGRIAFIYQIRKMNFENNKRDIAKKMKDMFFYFDKIINNQKITIITEGKTDKVYLSSAYSHFKEYYKLNFQIITKIPYTKHDSNNINNTGDQTLMNFVKELKEKNNIKPYKYLLEKSKIKNPKNPVIVIFDRDRINIIKEFEKNIKNENCKFVFFEPNIYYFVLPKLIGKEYLSIEYYFPNKILNKKIKGKNLSLCQEKHKKHIIYKIDENNDGLSKNEFSKYIKKLRYNTKRDNILNEKNKKYFDNFKSIFDIINDIRKDYKNKLQNINK